MMTDDWKTIKLHMCYYHCHVFFCFIHISKISIFSIVLIKKKKVKENIVLIKFFTSITTTYNHSKSFDHHLMMRLLFLNITFHYVNQEIDWFRFLSIFKLLLYVNIYSFMNKQMCFFPQYKKIHHHHHLMSGYYYYIFEFKKDCLLC